MPADLFAVPTVLLERFTALGVDVARVMRLAGVPMSRFAIAGPPAARTQRNGAPSVDGKARLTTREFLAVWRALETVGGRDLGLRIASQALPHQLDVATMAALHAADLGDALRKKARYKRLSCPQDITVEIRGGEARVRYHWTRAEGELPMLLVDTTFANTLALARRGTGTQVTPLRLELARRRVDPAALTRHFGCPIRFDAPADVLVFDAAALAIPFVTHNADLVAMLLPGLEAALDERPGRTLADDVRLALRRRMTGERPSVDQLARDLHIAPRTLQRRLGELGTSYQSLLDDVRHQAARNLLSTTDLDASEIAFLLGFEELNSFSRAFHAWEGASPLQWRARASRAPASKRATRPRPVGGQARPARPRRLTKPARALAAAKRSIPTRASTKPRAAAHERRSRQPPAHPRSPAGPG